MNIQKEYSEYIYSLKPEIEDLYVNKLKKRDIDIKYEELFKEIELDILDILANADTIDNSLLDKIFSTTYDKRIQWVKFELKNKNSSFNKSIELSVKMLSMPDSKIDGCYSIEEYEEKIKKELDKWKKSKTQNLTDFKFLSEKRKIAQQSAYNLDVKYYLLKKIIEVKMKKEAEDQIDKNSKMLINSLVGLPTDSSNKVSLYNDLENKNKLIYEYDGYEEKHNFIIDVDDVKNTTISSQAGKAVSDIFKVINDNDIKLFDFILMNRATNFFIDGKVSIVLKEATEYVYNMYSTRNKEKVIASLLKMSSLKGFRGVKDKKNVIGVQTALLGNTIEFDVETGKNVARVTVEETYRNEILNGNFIEIYGDISEQRKNQADVRKFMFFLQKQRLIRYYNRSANDTSHSYLIQKAPYTYFRQCVIFTNKRADRTKNRIYDALKAIVESKSILDEVIKKGDFFTLIYTPLTEKEIENLEEQLNNNRLAFLKTEKSKLLE